MTSLARLTPPTQRKFVDGFDPHTSNMRMGCTADPALKAVIGAKLWDAIFTGKRLVIVHATRRAVTISR